MKTSTIKGQVTKSKGRFLTITLSNKSGEQKFVGKVKTIGEKYITFYRYSGQRGTVRAHIDSVKGIK